MHADLELAVARFQVGQYAEAATYLELAAEKALADDSWNAPNDYWRNYAKAMQIGALSIRKTIEEKGPGPKPPRPKRRWRELVENAKNKRSNALDWEKLRAEAARIGLLALEKTLAK